jgi:hypothetical protein
VKSYDVLAVVRFFTPSVVGLVAFLLWWFVAALLMRVLGARLPLRPFGKEARRAVQLLTFSQSVWYGVLFNGCGMFIAMALFEYLSVRYWNAPLKDFSLRIGVYAVLWPAFGIFIGLLRADENKNRRTSSGLPKQGLKEISGWDESGFSR